jgi:hypothetical protein
MTMQNLVLAVQNTVPVAIIGTASSTVAFFRSVFGAIGVLVLGTILNNRSTDLITTGLAAKGIKVPAGSTGGASLDLNDMPAPIAGVVRAAFGDASAESFMVAGIIGVVAVLAVLFIKEVPLRRTVDILKAAQSGGAPGADPATAALPSVAPIGAHDAAASPEATGSPSSVPAADGGEPVRAGRPAASSARRAAIREVLAATEGEGEALDTELQLLLAESAPAAAQAAAPSAGTLEALQETQRILARQQAQLASLMERLADQLDEQQRLAAEQGATAKAQGETAAQLAQLQQELAAERQLQKEAALYLATRGRHSAN